MIANHSKSQIRVIFRPYLLVIQLGKEALSKKRDSIDRWIQIKRFFVSTERR